ncbi:MAG: 50S ribosomal protein L4, partial [Candidatus Paceibacterota bacterium]
MQLSVYNEKGTKKEALTLPEDIFGLGWNSDLLHQVIVAYRANARPTVAHAKDRSEKRGGGAKPWRQKGTGRARHGSIRSPLWAGGGATHAPLTERDFSKKVNKKMKRKALGIALSSKVRDNELLLVDSFSMKEP